MRTGWHSGTPTTGASWRSWPSLQLISVSSFCGCGRGLPGERLLARDEAVDSRRDVLQVIGIAAVDLGGDVAGVADLGQRPAHFRPVNLPFADIRERVG